MKKICFFIFGLCSVYLVCCQNTINSKEEMPQSLQMEEKSEIDDTLLLTKDDTITSILKEFYTLYRKAWKISDESWTKQVCLLLEKYCTKSFYEYQKEEFEEGGLNHDVLTADYGLDDESVATFVITKDELKENVYCLTYSTDSETPTGMPIKQTVSVQLEIIKENNSYKINNVLNPYSGICE